MKIYIIKIFLIFSFFTSGTLSFDYESMGTNYLDNDLSYGDLIFDEPEVNSSLNAFDRQYQTNFDDRDFRESVQMPFPRGTLLNVGPVLIIPFIPFGIFQLRIPLIFNLNNLVSNLKGGMGRSFEKDQTSFFGYIEDTISNTFAIDGKACVQRLICEISENSIGKSSFAGDILERIFEPRFGNAHLTDDYMEAQLKGRRPGQCWKSFGKCPFSLTNVFNLGS